MFSTKKTVFYAEDMQGTCKGFIRTSKGMYSGCVKALQSHIETLKEELERFKAIDRSEPSDVELFKTELLGKAFEDTFKLAAPDADSKTRRTTGVSAFFDTLKRMLPKAAVPFDEIGTLNPQEDNDEAREAVVELLDALSPIVASSVCAFSESEEEIQKCLKANANFAEAQVNISKLMSDD